MSQANSIPASANTAGSKGAISNRQLLYFARQSLLYRKLRSLLTVIGITVGIGAIFFLLSFGLGLRNLVTREVIGDRSIKSIDVTSPNSKVIKLTSEAVTTMASLPRTTQISRIYTFPGIVEFNGGQADAVVYGIDEAYAPLNDFNLVDGRSIANTDTDAAVVSRSIVRNWGFEKPSDILEKEFELAIPLDDSSSDSKALQQKFRVVGVIDADSGSEVFVAAGLFDAAGVDSYSLVKVVAEDTDAVESLRKQIESQGYLTSSPIDTLEQINQVFKFFTIILAGFGAIGMIVAVLGMFNTLTISLLERTKEIGLMFTLGARRQDMYRLFVFEALLLSMVGAITGIIVASLLSVIVTIVLNIFARSRGVQETILVFSYPLWLVAGLIIFMIAVGFIVVFFPARRARNISPIDALRRE